jgi:hypothetical protein
MQTTLKILSWIGKLAGILVTVDITGINPKYGPIVFFLASLVKDTVNRVGDYLDNQKMDGSFPEK